MSDAVDVRDIQSIDIAHIAARYSYLIRDTIITFEEDITKTQIAARGL